MPFRTNNSLRRTSTLRDEILISPNGREEPRSAVQVSFREMVRFKPFFGDP